MNSIHRLCIIVKWSTFRMSNLRLFILIDDSLSMAAKFGSGQAETILIGAKRLVKHFLSQTEKNPRLEILIQGMILIMYLCK